MKQNLLIGAISGNYMLSDVITWAKSSNFNDVKRVLLLYNDTNPELYNLIDYDIDIITPTFDFYGNETKYFEYNTGKCNTNTSYNLIHNIRFLHIWSYLQENKFNKILITDVKDVYFNSNPFDTIPSDKIIATSECITYNSHPWNTEHIVANLGVFSSVLFDKEVYNVGVFGGGYDLIKSISSDIYLMSAGKPKVADQTSFNYLINTIYKNNVVFTNLNDLFAVHLHVINEGHVPFNINTTSKYKIVHQYDRINGFILP